MWTQEQMDNLNASLSEASEPVNGLQPETVYAVTTKGAALSLWATRALANREVLRLRTSKEVKVLAPGASFEVITYRVRHGS